MGRVWYGKVSYGDSMVLPRLGLEWPGYGGDRYVLPQYVSGVMIAVVSFNAAWS